MHDLLHGEVTGTVDDFVVRRNDGVAAYNLAVVVDDAASGMDQVVRGDDLLPAAINQAYLATVLGAAPPTYAHVPLAVNADGRRLAKRDGAVTMAGPGRPRRRSARLCSALIADSLGLPAPRRVADLLAHFDPAALPREPWVFPGNRTR